MAALSQATASTLDRDNAGARRNQSVISPSKKEGFLIKPSFLLGLITFSDRVKDFNIFVDKIKIWPRNSNSSLSSLGVRDATVVGFVGAELFILSSNRPIMFLENVATAQINSIGGLSAIASPL
jgi:hypothetical protein